MPHRQGTDRIRSSVLWLRGRIESGEWPVNSKIPAEHVLEAELGVGRSTVREAVRSLATLGMLEPAPGRGTFVRSLGPVPSVLADSFRHHPVRELLVVRRGLEVEAARQAAMHRDARDLELLDRAVRLSEGQRGTSAEVADPASPGQFHSLVGAATKNAALATLSAALLDPLRAAMLRGELVAGDAGERQREHEELLAAIRAGDGDEAARLAGLHADHDLMLLEKPPAG